LPVERWLAEDHSVIYASHGLLVHLLD
jgi:hypothetical protein